MKLKKETIKALQQELKIYKFAEKHTPNIPIAKIKDCACMGPLPECKCKKQEQLINKFLTLNHDNN